MTKNILFIVSVLLAFVGCSDNKSDQTKKNNKAVLKDSKKDSILLNQKLMKTIEAGDLAKVKSLLSNGANANASRKSDGATALMIASAFGYIEIVELLLSQGADSKSKAGIIGETALGWAARYGKTEVVKLLLDEGLDINAKASSNGWTALIGASKWGHTDTVKLLLSRDADPKVKDLLNKTALMYAKEEGHTEIESLLKQVAGATE